jgi:hypothetical protein
MLIVRRSTFRVISRRRCARLTNAECYRATPATNAATMYVACLSKDTRARSYRMVVRGSACDAASCTSRSGTPASKLQ